MLNSVDSEKKLKTPEEAESALASFFGTNITGSDNNDGR
jgi:hypothetical protein